MEILMNSNEKVARTATDIESNATHFNVNETNTDDTLISERSEKFDESVNAYMEQIKNYMAYIENFAKELKDGIGDFDMIPVGKYVIIRPFPENPFQLIKKQDGIYTDLGGKKIDYKSNETGEIEEEENFIDTGVVVRTGPDCKQIKVGDAVFCTKPSEVPMPFYKQGLVVVDESRVMSIIRPKN